MHLPGGFVVRIVDWSIKWLRVKFGALLPKYPRFQTHAERPFTDCQLQSLADHINHEYRGHYDTYTPEAIKAWLDICPDIYQVVFDRVLFHEKVVGCYKVLPLTDIALRKIFDGTFESIKAKREDIAPTFERAKGLWIGDLIVSKAYRVVDSGNAVSKGLFLHLKTVVKRYRDRCTIFARTERDDMRELLINQGFVPFVREGEALSGHTPFVRFTEDHRRRYFRPHTAGAGQQRKRSTSRRER